MNSLEGPQVVTPTPDHVLRNGTGNYACPACFHAAYGETTRGVLVPPVEHCPDCGAQVDWSEAMLLAELNRITYEMISALTPILSVPGREINATVEGESVAKWAASLYAIVQVRTNRPR